MHPRVPNATQNPQRRTAKVKRAGSQNRHHSATPKNKATNNGHTRTTSQEQKKGTLLNRVQGQLCHCDGSSCWNSKPGNQQENPETRNQQEAYHNQQQTPNPKEPGRFLRTQDRNIQKLLNRTTHARAKTKVEGPRKKH